MGLVAAVLGALVPASAVVGRARPSAVDIVDPALARQLTTADPADRLVVFVHADDVDAARAAAHEAGLSVLLEFAAAGAVAAAGTPVEVTRVQRVRGVTFVEADQRLRYGLDSSHRATRGEQARRAFARLRRPNSTAPAYATPIDGRGVTIAINDSGVDASHPFFRRNGRSKVVRHLRFTCPDEPIAVEEVPAYPEPLCASAPDQGWVDSQSDDSDSGTGGHGTHVAGIAAGVDVKLSDGTRLHGAAPGAPLVVLASGAGLSVLSAVSGLNWVLHHHRDPCGRHRCPPIRVVNNSWGPDLGGGDHEPRSIVAKLSSALARAGVVVVFSAGNGGGDGRVNQVNPFAQNPTPGVIGVANYDDRGIGTRDGPVADSSSRGRRGRPATFPDVSAPGTDILSSCRATMPVCTGADPHDGGDYDVISGTSMAAPHVAGIVAQLLQVRPKLTPKQVENILEDTAYGYRFGASYVPDLARRNDGLTSQDKGHGLVDVVAAIGRLLGVDTGARPPTPCTLDRDPTSTMFGDPRGDTAVGPAATGDPSLDIRRVSVHATASAVTYTLHVSDLEAPSTAATDYFELNVAARTATHQLVATVDALGTPVFTYDTGNDLVDVTGSWSASSNRITVKVPTVVWAGGRIIANVRGARLSVLSARSADPLLYRDSATGGCPVIVPGEARAADVVDAVLSVGGAAHEWNEAFVADALDVGGECDLVFDCGARFLSLRVPDGGAVFALDLVVENGTPPEVTIRGKDGAVVFRGFTERVRLPVRWRGVYEVLIDPAETVLGGYDARARLLSRSSRAATQRDAPGDALADVVHLAD